VVKTGTTPVLEAGEWRKLLDSIPTETVRDLRDRALIATLLALHVLEVLDAFERSSIEGRHIVIETPCGRPEKLPLGSGEEVFA
jgi:hypothetical protein